MTPNAKNESKAIDFNVFLQDGVIIDLVIKRWRGKNKLDESEMGLQQSSNNDYSNFMNKYVTLGSKNLFPKDVLEKISSIEVRTRKNLKEYSYESPWGRFVPLTAYDKWKENNEKFKEEFFKMRDEIVDDYPNIISTVKEDYKPLAGSVYKRINGLPIDQPTAIPSDFIQEFLQSIIDQIPSPDEIKESFIFEVNLSSLPDLVTGMSGESLSPIPPVSYSPTQEDNNSSVPNTEKIVSMLPKEVTAQSKLTTEEKSKKKKEIQTDINKSMLGENNEKLELFIGNVLTKIRELSIEASDDIIKSIDKNEGKLVGRTSLRATNLINKVRALDFYGDNQLKEYIDELEKLMEEKPKERSVEDIKRQVSNIKTYSEKSLSELMKKQNIKSTSQKRTVPHGKKSSQKAVPLNVKPTQKRNIK